MSPDGQTLLRGGWGSRIRLWSTATGKPRGDPIEFPRPEFNYDWSGDGKRLYLADSEKNIRVLDTASGKVVRRFNVDAISYIIGVDPGEKWSVHPAAGNRIKLRDAQTGAELRSFQSLPERLHALTFSPSASRLLAAYQGGTLKLWDAVSGDEIAATKLSGIYIDQVRFSPDGKRLAVVGNLRRLLTGEVRILDAESLQEIRSLKGHTLNVMDVVFTPDGQRLATASYDRTVRIWDLATGQETLKLSGYEAFRIRFVSNGRRLIGASMDLKIRVWDATPMPDQ
jgi:WD40 repeat protein